MVNGVDLILRFLSGLHSQNAPSTRRAGKCLEASRKPGVTAISSRLRGNAEPIIDCYLFGLGAAPARSQFLHGVRVFLILRPSGALGGLGRL